MFYQFPMWYPGSGVVFDCIDSYALHPYLLSYIMGVSLSVYMLNSNHVYSGNLRLLRVALALKIRFHSLLIRITSSGR